MTSGGGGLIVTAEWKINMDVEVLWMFSREDHTEMYLEVKPEETNILIDYEGKIYPLLASWMKKR